MPNLSNRYPDGLMFYHDSDVYYIKQGKRYRTYSPRTYASWGLTMRPADDDITRLPLVKQPLGFRDGTLIHNVADGRMYLISGGKRRQITSPDVFERFGVRPRDIMYVSDDEAKLHEPGDVIN